MNRISVVAPLLCVVCLLIALPMCLSSQTRPLYNIKVYRGVNDTIGSIVVRLFPSITPLHARNFDSIVRLNGYDGTAFHRVIPGFVIQGGDPNSISGDEATWGTGNPAQTKIPAEFNNIPHLRGRMGMARTNDPNSATSQFYICHGSPTFLDLNYTVFGETVSGYSVIDTVALASRNGDDRPFTKHSMLVRYIGEDSTKPTKAQLATPVNGARVVSVNKSTNFTWLVDSTVVRSIVHLSTDSSFTSGVRKQIGANSNVGITLTEGSTTFYWRVETDNGGATELSDVFSFRTSVAEPLLLTPENNAINVPQLVSLQWQAVAEDSAMYHVQVATTSTFIPNVIVVNDSTLVSAEPYAVTGLLPAKKYFWRVRARGESAWGGYSARFSFTTEGATSVQETDAQNTLTIFPMPVHEQLQIDFKGAGLENILVRIYNNLGSVVLHQEGSSTLVNVSHLEPGLYVLGCSGNGFAVQKTFIKF